MPKHILGNFQQALDDLTKDLNSMANLVVQNLENAMKGLLVRDTALCAQVIADDEEIDHLEVKIDREGVNILMLYQPVATDLRRVITAMKVSANLERVADQSVGIAKRARKINRNTELAETRLVEPVYDQAIALLRSSIEAYRQGGLETALGIKDRDAELDKTYKAVARQLTQRMEEDSERVKDYLNLQFIVRFLERIGDHAKNIAEDTVFVKSALDIRHGRERPEVPSEES